MKSRLSASVAKKDRRRARRRSRRRDAAVAAPARRAGLPVQLGDPLSPAAGLFRGCWSCEKRPWEVPRKPPHGDLASRPLRCRCGSKYSPHSDMAGRHWAKRAAATRRANTAELREARRLVRHLRRGEGAEAVIATRAPPTVHEFGCGSSRPHPLSVHRRRRKFVQQTVMRSPVRRVRPLTRDRGTPSAISLRGAPGRTGRAGGRNPRAAPRVDARVTSLALRHL